jgi:hypothetical protein
MPDGNFSTGAVNFTETEGGFSGSGNVSAVYLVQRAPPTPANGPPVPYVYSNLAGTFKLSTGGAPGAARYVWQGVLNNDTLNFIGFGSVQDNSGIGLPTNASADVWLYQASDAIGNVWYLAFGVDALNLPGPSKYPLYYSYVNPVVGGNLKRWITPTGTERL